MAELIWSSASCRKFIDVLACSALHTWLCCIDCNLYVDMMLFHFQQGLIEATSPDVFNAAAATSRSVTTAKPQSSLMIAWVAQAREKFKEFPTIPPGLDIMEEQEQLVHQLELTENYPTHVEFDVFRHTEGWEEQDAEYSVGL